MAMIYRAVQVKETDVSRYAWTGLRKFHHVPSITEHLKYIHNITDDQISNARKQATQIRQCLMQAQEYRDASKVTSLVTKPLLLYYSLMSLALAQILFNGSGDVSLDRARGHNAHHGLELTTKPLSRSSYSLAESAGSLVARPMTVKGQRRGTFELWCQISREDPIVGYLSEREGMMGRKGINVLFAGHDVRFCYLGDKGISLLDCFEAIPSLRHNLHHLSSVIRASISREVVGELSELRISIHPHHNISELQSLYESITLEPGLVDCVQAVETSDSMSFRIIENVKSLGVINLPASSTWTSEEVRFLPVTRKMNEFGYLYLALYIIGNYSRYFPDRWIRDVEEGSPLALMIDELLTDTESRMALLTLANLSQTYFVPT